MGAPSTAVPAAAPVPVVAVAASLVVHHPIVSITVQDGENGGDEEEDAVHDAEGEAGLEHSARLVDGDVDSVEVGRTEDAKTLIIRAACLNVGAVGARDPTEVVHAGDQSANEAEVDETDEARIGLATVVAEQGEDGPGRAEDRDNEQYQNVCRSEEVVLIVAADKVGKHSEKGNLLGAQPG